jgi:hypothetical protein
MLRTLLIASMCVACSTVHTIHRKDLPDFDGEGEVKLSSAREAKPVGGLHAVGGKLDYADVAEVSEVTYIRRGKGFWEGAAIGAATAFGLGLVTGIVWNTTCSKGQYSDGFYPNANCPISEDPSLSDGVVLGLLLGGLAIVPGALIGGSLGALYGDHTTYVFKDP